MSCILGADLFEFADSVGEFYEAIKSQGYRTDLYKTKEFAIDVPKIDSRKELAEVFKVSTGTISNLITLSRVVPEFRELARKKVVTLGACRDIAKLSRDEQAELYREVKKTGKEKLDTSYVKKVCYLKRCTDWSVEKIIFELSNKK